MGMNVDYKGIEIGTLPADASSTYVAGRAVRMGTDGKATTNILTSKKALGLCNETRISQGSIQVDEIGGKDGIYGSGKVTVLASGIATVQQSRYQGTSFNVYDETLTYVADDVIFASPSTGVLTNVSPSGALTPGLTSVRIGRVLVPPTNPANGDPMQITVECM